MDYSQSSSEDEFQFDAEIGDPNKLIPMLKAIQIMQTTVMAITKRGLRLTCEDPSKCIQATSFIDRNFFSHYTMSDEETPALICFRLSDLLNVLAILSPTQQTSDQSLRISYLSSEDVVKLVLKDDAFETKARIKTFSSDELMLFETNFCNKVIINAESIVDFWKSVDLTSEHIKISLYEREPYFQWSTESPRALVNHNIHRDSTQIEQYLCAKEVSNRYKMSLMKSTIKAMTHATKLSLRTDEDGLLSLQFMIDLDQPNVDHSFVEYYILPDIENPL